MYTNNNSYFNIQECIDEKCNSLDNAKALVTQKCERNLTYDPKTLLFPANKFVNSTKKCYSCNFCDLGTNGEVEECDQDSVCEVYNFKF